MGSHSINCEVLNTRIVPVNTTDLGHFKDTSTLDRWITPKTGLDALHEAADHLKTTSIPVGFPTETVYGLGADATRSDAVKGIYAAKGRPSDNPLIIHVCDLDMLRSLLSSSSQAKDPVPEIYNVLIKKFWPGPLTILLPNPTPSKLAPEVTAGLPSFGARMPDSPLALSLISLSGVPLAAPSANASTKPSPTTAQHVLHDLDGKIEIILDGGTCTVGVESTVVDGLCAPPVVLRPGGVSIDSIKECAGWESVVKGYKDASEVGTAAPRAPGMKYKHYSPKAKVVLYEAAAGNGSDTKTGIPLEAWRVVSAQDKIINYLGYELLGRPPKIGIVTTRHWKNWAGFHGSKWSHEGDGNDVFTRVVRKIPVDTSNSFKMTQGELWQGKDPQSTVDGEVDEKAWEGLTQYQKHRVIESDGDVEWKNDRLIAYLIEISLGNETKDIAHGLFSALRELDSSGVDIIYVEGIEDEGDIAAAVMNRLRKAASIIEK